MISWLESKVASQYSKFIPRDKIVAIGGTFAQKETALACKMVLSEKGQTISSTDFSSLSQTMLKIGPKVKKGIFEIRSTHFGQINELLTLVKPEIGIIVGLDQTGAESLGNFDQIILEYSQLLTNPPLTTAILNWDNLNCRKLVQNYSGEVIFFGTDSKSCHLWAGNINLNNLKVGFELNFGVERVEINTHFIASHQIYPLLAAAALGVKENLRLTQIKRALEKVYPLDEQIRILPGFAGSQILDNSYEDSPYQAEQALESLSFLPARRRILVLGEIRRLGSFTSKINKQLAHKIYKEKLDLIFLTKGQIFEVGDELLKLGFIAERMEQDLTNPQIVANLLKVLVKGDLVLVSGSRELRLDEVVKKISRIQ